MVRHRKSDVVFAKRKVWIPYHSVGWPSKSEGRIKNRYSEERESPHHKPCAPLPMNGAHPLTPSLSPSEGERVPIGRVRGFMGSKTGGREH